MNTQHQPQLDSDSSNIWHVFPMGDLREHITDGFDECWCSPSYNDSVVTHNSLDGREYAERGQHVINIRLDNLQPE